MNYFMGIEDPNIGSVESATEIGDLLTPHGIESDYAPAYIAGNVISESSGTFFGKETILAEIRARLEDTGFAAVEGGHRTGRSSLLRVTSERMVKDESVQAEVYYDLRTDHAKTPEQVIAEIEERISRYHLPGEGTKPVSALIQFDEIEGYEPSNRVKLLEAIGQMKAKGHKIIIAVLGDLYGDSPGELSRQTKDKILEMAGGRVVINRLLNDEEMRKLLAYGGKPVFTEVMTRYLIAEAGGHPYLANELARTIFRVLKSSEFSQGKLTPRLKVWITFSSLDNVFSSVVETIVAAGFNPLTWEWHGSGNKPNVEVYQNMIPRPTSTIFRDWLTAYTKTIHYKRFIAGLA